MASILSEYISRKLSVIELREELQKLISDYNRYTGRYLFVYAADINKSTNKEVKVSLVQEDFYIIQDILRESDKKEIDFYIETPGGSGEAAEEIARFLRRKFDKVNFVIAGEAKSAGTILVLSGDNIYMTETGSLGPIDAQVSIGRSIVSAYDYMEWVEQKRQEATKNKGLNPFDAIMVAQISPGELYQVSNHLEFAIDLVKNWLVKHKFKDWTVTQTRGIQVTEEMKKDRADKLAKKLCNHGDWRTHRRSLKIEDLSEELQIENLDEDPQLADIVYRINVVIRLIFEMSTSYKLYFLEDFKLAKTYSVNRLGQLSPVPIAKSNQPKQPSLEGVELEITCPKCKQVHQVIGYIDVTSEEIRKKHLKTNPNIQDNNMLVCDNCNYTLDLQPIKNQIESQIGKKVLFK